MISPSLMITLAVVGGLIALFWPSAAKKRQPLTLDVHPAAKQLPEVEAFAALQDVKTFLAGKGVSEAEFNAAIEKWLIHFTTRGS